MKDDTSERRRAGSRRTGRRSGRKSSAVVWTVIAFLAGGGLMVAVLQSGKFGSRRASTARQTTSMEPTAPRPGSGSGEVAELRTRRLKQLLDEAEQFAKTPGSDAQEAIKKFRRLEVEGKGTEFASKAAARRESLEKDFKAEKALRDLAATVRGHVAQAELREALGALTDFAQGLDVTAAAEGSQTREVLTELRKSVEEEAAALFEKRTAEANALAEAGEYEKARALFEPFRELEITDIQTSLGEMLEGLNQQEQQAKEEAALARLERYEARFEGVARLVKLHRYDGALKQLGTLAEDPEHQGLEDRMGQDQSDIACAKEVYDAASVALASSIGQTITVKKVRGKLVKAADGSVVLSSGGAEFTLPFSDLPAKDIADLAAGAMAKIGGRGHLRLAVFWFFQDDVSQARKHLDKARAARMDVSPYEARLDAILVITSSPSGASVQLTPVPEGGDGKVVSPARVTVAKNTVYTLRATRTGCRPAASRVRTRGGGEYPVALRLAKLPGKDAGSEEPVSKLEALRQKLKNLPAAYKKRVRTYRGHAYLYVPDKTNWGNADTQCRRWGGHLVSISSKSENAFVFQIAEKGWAWIGMNDLRLEGTWVWANGERVGYTNWMVNEPNNSYGTEDYAAIGNDGQWNDLPFNAWTSNPGLAYVCEWE